MKKLEKIIISKKIFFITFLAQVIYYSFFLIIYYPGILATDSIVQWGQSINGAYFNTHPFFHTFVVDIFQTLTGSPASMAFFQIVVSAFVFSLFFELFYKNKLNKKLLVVFLLFTLINPIVIVYNINIWKDTLYSYILLFILYRLVKDLLEKKPLKIKYLLGIAFLVAVAASFRFNGLINIILVPFIYFVLKLLSIKRTLMFLAMVVFFYIFIQYGFSSILVVRNDTLKYYSERQRLTFLGAALQNPNDKLTESETTAISRMGEGIDKIRECYACINSRWISRCAKNIDIGNFNNRELFRNYSSAVNSVLLRNINYIIGDRICSASYVTGLKGDDTNYKFDTKIVPNNFGFERTEQFQNTRQIVNSYLSTTSKGIFAIIFWTPFVGILVAIFFAIYGIYKKNRILTGIGLFVLGNAFFLLAINISNHVRYLMIVQLFFIISAPLFLVFRKKK